MFLAQKDLKNAVSNHLGICKLINIRCTYPKNPVTGHLNIDLLRNRIISPREKIDKTSLDVFCIDETKLKESLPDSQIQLKEYQFPHSVKIVTQRLVEKWFL